MTIVQRMPRFLVAIVAVALALVLAIPLTGAKGGNSAVAKACQKGGWQQLASSDDPYTAFASQDACVSHGAQGGTVVPLIVETRSASQIQCEDDFDGAYTKGDGVARGTVWDGILLYRCTLPGANAMSLMGAFSPLCFATTEGVGIWRASAASGNVLECLTY
ncbi:hypothetical protein GCM10022200_01620 [Microbacterium awajiense]|uniref:Secreted protein n=1 Tax=Microbacterium awajiense TaxID=415214 RepID=A0ABP6ZZN6_9MICO